MKLIIGGYAQGKLDYVLEKYGLKEDSVWEGALPNRKEPAEKTVVINRFQNWVRNRIADGGCPQQEVGLFLEQYRDCIIICDEIGNGIVPNDPLEREYRECTGRILIQLAERAEEVERVLCGIGQRIK